MCDRPMTWDELVTELGKHQASIKEKDERIERLHSLINRHIAHCRGWFGADDLEWEPFLVKAAQTERMKNEDHR